MKEKNKTNNRAANCSAPETDEPARRLNEQVLWENTVNGAFPEDGEPKQDRPPEDWGLKGEVAV